jgi:hypothetical protein
MALGGPYNHFDCGIAEKSSGNLSRPLPPQTLSIESRTVSAVPRYLHGNLMLKVVRTTAKLEISGRHVRLTDTNSCPAFEMGVERGRMERFGKSTQKGERTNISILRH